MVQLEKIIDGKKGASYLIIVELHIPKADMHAICFKYICSLYHKKKSEKNWKICVPKSFQEDNTQELLKRITKEQLQSIKFELWNKLKPNE